MDPKDHSMDNIPSEYYSISLRAVKGKRKANSRVGFKVGWAYIIIPNFYFSQLMLVSESPTSTSPSFCKSLEAQLLLQKLAFF